MFSPFETKETILKKGQQIAKGLKPPTDDIVIYTNTYLSVKEDKAFVLVSWNFYGKSVITASRYKKLVMGNQKNTGLTKFELSDPNY